MIRIVWTPEAELDLAYIYARIFMDNPAAAERLVANIEQKTKPLHAHPQIGVLRPDIRAQLRMLAVPPHLIFYEIETVDQNETQEVRLLRIIDGRRDLRALL